MSVRCLELYSGIGGFALAASQLDWQVVRAIDINQVAAEIYRLNFTHDHQVRTIESIPDSDFASVHADLWWLSPPCQPFTRRGEQRDVEDARTDSFLHILELIKNLQPTMLAMENVPEFSESEAAARLRNVLQPSGYRWLEFELCPTDFGIPNRRRRFYLAAARDREPSSPTLRPEKRRLDDYLSDEPFAELFVDDQLLADYGDAMHCIRREDARGIAACFTSGYGKSPIRSGSFLWDGGRLRRFSPREILRLLGFPESYQIPQQLTTRQAWKLVGNSLSVPVVGHVVRSFARGVPSPTDSVQK